MSQFLQGLAAIALSFGLSQLVCAQNNAIRIGDDRFELQPPTLSGIESSQVELSAIRTATRGLPIEQFTRDSVVAPVRIQLRYLRASDGTKIGHDVHAMFVVHTQLDEFSPEDFADRLAGKRDEAQPINSKDVSASILQSLDLEADEETRFKLVEFDLLEKIRLSGLFEFRNSKSERQRQINFHVIDEHDNRWRSLMDENLSGNYRGLAGHLTATELAELDGVVLIELRLLMHEPQDWFAGSNFLRSKLPLVLQETARDIRRSLKR